MRKVKYKTEAERINLISAANKANEVLIEDAILTDGNYLIFDILPVEEKSIEDEQEEKIIEEEQQEPIEQIKEEPPQPTKESINAQVVEMIREKYSINDEFEMHRLGLIDNKNINFLQYLSYVKKCITWGNQEKEKL